MPDFIRIFIKGFSITSLPTFRKLRMKGFFVNAVFGVKIFSNFLNKIRAVTENLSRLPLFYQCYNFLTEYFYNIIILILVPNLKHNSA